MLYFYFSFDFKFFKKYYTFNTSQRGKASEVLLKRIRIIKVGNEIIKLF